MTTTCRQGWTQDSSVGEGLFDFIGKILISLEEIWISLEKNLISLEKKLKIGKNTVKIA